MRATAEKNHFSTVLFAGLLILVAWLPVPLGSNRLWSWELMHAAAMVGVGLWCVGCLWRPRTLPPAIRQQPAVLVLLGCWMTYLDARRRCRNAQSGGFRSL